ncbi:RtcB family protein [bacterium]|nr:RtcB family protein [candidate division CSSED10-310 bacterium]
MKLEQIGQYRWKLPIGSIPGMRVPGIVYADDRMVKTIQSDGSLNQLANAATLPGIESAAIAMPDIHFGYGLPIGGILACNSRTGIISPGGVGYDINCGVRMIRTPLSISDVRPYIERLVDRLYQTIPCGVGSDGKIRLDGREIRKVMQKGSAWAVEAGYGVEKDTIFCESSGRLDDAGCDDVSDRAIVRGRDQLGTLGSGNHFIEIQAVHTIFDNNAAELMGLEENQVTIMIHSGSRGLGHQVCTDYLQLMVRNLSKHHIVVPDRQLACAPIDSADGRRYWGAMKAAANFAWANRQCLTHWVREALQEIFGTAVSMDSMGLLYDVAHNIVKIETHEVNGKQLSLAVHRKGATRAFGSHHPDIPERYRTIGQPVLIPGDMGTQSFILTGTETAMRETFGSACHGAGRRLSRKAALKLAKNRSIEQELRQQGIYAKAEGRFTLGEEMPEAYKDIADVIEVIRATGIGKPVAVMIPLGVLKG